MCKHKNNQAFTLVELSIVLVVIGLLIGSTLAGKALLANSETKTLLAEVQKLNTSIGSFQAMYKGLPGDIANATRYWGTYVASTKVNATVDGNGNGRIAAETSDEAFRALQQLYLANLLDGSFAVGSAVDTTYSGFIGQWGSGFTLSSPVLVGNVIGAKGRTGAALYVKCCSSTDYARTITFKNHISLFSVYSADITKRAGVITPIEAYEIDKKVDDGVPDTGLVGGSGSWTGAAYAATGCYRVSGATTVYETDNVTNTTYKNAPGCQMQFAYDWD